MTETREVVVWIRDVESAGCDSVQRWILKDGIFGWKALSSVSSWSSDFVLGWDGKNWGKMVDFPELDPFVAGIWKVHLYQCATKGQSKELCVGRCLSLCGDYLSLVFVLHLTKYPLQYTAGEPNTFDSKISEGEISAKWALEINGKRRKQATESWLLTLVRTPRQVAVM